MFLVILSIGSVLTHEPFSVHTQSKEPGFREKIHKVLDFSLRRESHYQTEKKKKGLT